MCKSEVFTFSECPHRIPSGEVAQCGLVRHGNNPQCDPLQEDEIPMGEKCHDCLEEETRQAHSTREADEAAELQRIIEESQRTFEQEERREPTMSQEEMGILKQALRESAEFQHPEPRGGDFDEDELAQILQLSLELHESEANKPKHFLKQKLRYECGHETDLGITDIEFDPMSEGLPYIEHNERGRCPDCGGSSSRASAGRTIAGERPILGHPEPLTTEPEDEDSGAGFTGFDDTDDLPDFDIPGCGKGPAAPRPTTPLPGWSSAEDYAGERPANAPPNTPANSPPPIEHGSTHEAHPSPEVLRQRRVQFYSLGQTNAAPSDPANTQHAETNGEDAGYSSDGSSEAPENPPYATVDNLALAGLEGEVRERAERQERNRVERLRLEGTLARQDSGDMSGPDAAPGSLA